MYIFGNRNVRPNRKPITNKKAVVGRYPCSKMCICLDLVRTTLVLNNLYPERPIFDANIHFLTETSNEIEKKN